MPFQEGLKPLDDFVGSAQISIVAEDGSSADRIGRVKAARAPEQAEGRISKSASVNTHA